MSFLPKLVMFRVGELSRVLTPTGVGESVLGTLSSPRAANSLWPALLLGEQTVLVRVVEWGPRLGWLWVLLG